MNRSEELYVLLNDDGAYGQYTFYITALIFCLEMLH